MKDLLERIKKRLAEEETIRCLKFLAIPFLAVILIAIIMAADRPGKGQEAESIPVMQNETEPGPEAETKEVKEKTEESTEENTYRLEEAGEEITDLIETYFKARRTCDVNTLQKVYGDSASPDKLREESLRMEEEVKYYQSYSDIVCYSAAGPEADTKVVYTRFMVKFRQADTLAPGMFACLVKQEADGGWHMAAAVTPEEEAYLNRVNESDQVQAMVREVNSGLRTALESDSNLLSVYNVLMNGSQSEDGEPANDESAVSESDMGAPANSESDDGQPESAGE